MPYCIGYFLNVKCGDIAALFFLNLIFFFFLKIGYEKVVFNVKILCPMQKKTKKKTRKPDLKIKCCLKFLGGGLNLIGIIKNSCLTLSYEIRQDLRGNEIANPLCNDMWLGIHVPLYTRGRL